MSDYEISAYNPTIHNIQSFHKTDLSTFQKSQISALTQQLPTMMAGGVMSKAYIMKFPNGLPHTPMAYKTGGVGTSIVGKNKRIVGHASLHALDSAAVLLNAFSVLSMATGQYFLTQINNEFTMVSQKLDKIIDFLYGDKKSELIAEINFVQYAQKNYSSIIRHDSQREATISSLQASKKIAMKDIEFYLLDLGMEASSSEKSFDEFQAKADRAFRIRDSLTLSIQLYTLSSFMEMYYAANNDPEYLDFVKNDLIYYINKCEKQMLSNFSKLNGYLGNYKSTVVKKIDTAQLEKRFSVIIDSLSDGGASQAIKTVNKTMALYNSPIEYYVDTDGNVLARLAG